ncbi:MAG: alcohol dehydrogenase catalytic domain-containing protein [Anaerolineae bacterium]|jgi:NADPH:quinone reductase-like Zn-dependent oxidoreductase
MQAIYVREFGGPEVLSYESAPLPAVLGMEAAGTVDALGLEVTDLQAGDRVACAMQLGAYAAYAIIPVWKLVPMPDGVSTRQAASVMLQGITAHYLSHGNYRIQAGDTMLIHAAAGGVGQLLVQIAKRLGARVIGTVSTPEKARLVAATVLSPMRGSGPFLHDNPIHHGKLAVCTCRIAAPLSHLESRCDTVVGNRSECGTWR